MKPERPTIAAPFPGRRSEREFVHFPKSEVRNPKEIRSPKSEATRWGQRSRGKRTGRTSTTSLSLSGWVLLLLFPFTGLGADTNRAATPARLDYSAFKIITERNIFDPNRSSRPPDPSREPRRQARIDSFALVGTLAYEKGPFAFFDGTSSSYRKVLEIGETIAGYKVVDIAENSVKLANGTNTVEILVGGAMRREDEGAWQPSSRGAFESAGADASNEASSNETPAKTSSGEESDVLKRLMQKREQELK